MSQQTKNMAQACERHLDTKLEHIETCLQAIETCLKAIETCSTFHRNTTCLYVYQMCHNVAKILILD